MPTTTYMVVDPRHDHSMRIPRPDLSVALGVPNACNACHTKQTAQWAADAIVRWNGKGARGFQEFALAFRAGAVGAPEARRALVGIIDDKSQPAVVRASAIARLARWMSPSTIPSVARALNDADALVRLAAVEALAHAERSIGQRYLPRMLADPVRSVRVEAARAIAGAMEAGLAADERVLFEAALAELIAAQSYNADQPDGRAGLGRLYALRGSVDAAIAEYRKALELDPTFVPAYVNLADLHRARGVEGEAEAVLRAGLAKVPNAAALRHALGLVLARQQRYEDMQKELAEAVRLDPDNARYAYVHAVALYDVGQPARALKLLEATLRRQPYDRDVLSALALYRSKEGRRDVALDYVKRLRDLDPEDPRYAQWARQIEGVR